MKPVILLHRAGITRDGLDLRKAGRSHKYFKREPYFSGGKLRWRYYYNTPEDRERWHKEHDPDGQHKHHLKDEIHHHHEKLTKEMPPTASLNADAIKELMEGMAPRGTDLKVHISARFERAHKQPFVANEETGQQPERNPIQRVAKAFDMVPDAVRSLISVRSLKITTRNDPAVKKMFEKGENPRPVPAAYSDRDGALVFCADGEGHGGGLGFNVHPSGWPRFGSPLTSSEETVWREVGRQLRYAIASKKKDAWKEWQDLSTSPGDAKLSAFAMQNTDHDFMETFACAMSHPKQLARQAPARYEFMRKHGLADLPPIDEMLSKPDGDLAWWESQEETGARKLLAEKMAEEPKGTPYLSTKDEFFQVSKGGRTVYFRIGPTSPDEEENWETMPDTIDPETGYPIYDKKVSNRFKQKEQIKEIYDEHGNRLTDEAAFYFLNQDEDIKSYNKSTHYLGYSMFIGLGENTGNAEKERKTIRKMEAKGKDPAEKRASRWEKIPHKISRAEFQAKTPSFAFGALREAKSQPYKKLQDGKEVIHINPQTGKEEPQLTARVYESVNPDGSLARMTVMESSSFEYGEEVILPITEYRKDPETGEVFEQVVEKEVVLDPKQHPDISPEGLAKQHGITTERVLKRNQKFQQYQFLDPMMAALINPSGVPIKDQATLSQLLQAAADAQPEVWTTVAFGSDPISRAHLKVKFDGGGSPVLVGPEWQRKLGKAVPRVSDLLTSSGKPKIEKPKRRKPRRRKIKEGGWARFKDKESGKWVFGRVLEKDTSGGKRRYQVQPLPGQGVDTEPREVRQVKSVPTDMDPERPNIEIREYQAPQNTVLLHMDEMQVDEKRRPLSGTGKMKIKMPQDGSWNFETMMRVPGVTVDDNGDLLLDPRKIDDFRAHVGSFILDEHAEAALARVRSISKAEAEAGRAGKTPLSDIVDPSNGNLVNTDGLLKGCRKRLPNGKAFRLGSHQAELLKAMADNDGRIIGAHFMGTGKTVSALCAVKMMQNLTTEDGKPHPNRPKRVAIVVPKSTAQQWVSSAKTFTESRATLIGADDMAGSLQMPSPPKGFENWSDAKKEAWRQEQLQSQPGLWRPEEDDTDMVIITEDYFTSHAEELKRIGGFDGIIVDEAHGVQAGGERVVDGGKKGNKRAKEVEKWNPDMKMMMLLTGTPVTNKLTTIANYMKMISNGEEDLGTEKEFEEKFLIESAVQKASGTGKAEKMDLNPQTMGELHKKMKPYIHVATTADVKDKTIPGVLLDENTPVAMDSVQSMLYRGYMDQLSPEDKRNMELAAALGENEDKLLSDEGKASVRVARNITNTPAYKPKDGRKFVTFTETLPPKGRAKKGKKKTHEFSMPGWDRFKREFGGRFPSAADVADGKISHEEFIEMQKWIGYALDRDYGDLSGRKLLDVLSSEELTDLRKGNPMGGGLQFGKKVPNPEYGPEAMIARGERGSDGRIKPIEHIIRNADGSIKEIIKVPVGLRFIRGSQAQYFMGGLPDDHPRAGEFESDWDFSKGDAVKEGRAGQKPKEGREKMSVLRHPERRRERMMFDLVTTTGNAKTDEMERYIAEKTDPSQGGNPNGQMILFGGTYPALRTMESKMRLMGYKDVNEALNDALMGDDPIPSNGKYFVTYMGGGGNTLGDRDLNSEIFRKRKGPDGRDLDQSMFVHRALHGTDGEPPKVGEITQGWSASERSSIAKAFSGIEMPAQVTAVDVGGQIEYRYAYTSDMSEEDQKTYADLENRLAQAEGDEFDKLQSEMKSLLSSYWSDRKPLTERQMGVFNNCQFMIASDAAQVGLNWGNASDLMMYDSLFSPMNEWQRITRAARMLDPAVEKKVRPIFDQMAVLIDEKGAEGELEKFEGNASAALAIVQDTLDTHPDLRQKLMVATEKNPAAIAETFLAQRSLDRINALRGPILKQLQSEGRVLTSAPKVRDPETGEMVFQRVKPQEITSTDVMNEIIEKHLKPFERQVLRSRKYLVDVKRLTTSVEVPEMETVKVDGKQVERPTGRMKVEHPSKAEKAVLMRGRAKQVPTEKFLGLMQQNQPVEAAYDFVPATQSTLTSFAKPEQQQKTEQQKAAAKKRRDEYKEMRRQEAAKRQRIRAKKKAEKKAAKERRKAERKAAAEAKKRAKAEAAAKRQQAKDDAQKPPQEGEVLAHKSMRPARKRLVFYTGKK